MVLLDFFPSMIDQPTLEYNEKKYAREKKMCCQQIQYYDLFKSLLIWEVLQVKEKKLKTYQYFFIILYVYEKFPTM